MTGPVRPQVTVVVVTWNGAHLLPDCLAGLAEQTHRDHRVVVVDNASTDGTAEWLEQEHPQVDVVRLPRNLGFAGGNHAVLGDVGSPYVVLLNNDARPRPGFLAELVRAAEDPGTSHVAAFTAKVLLAGRYRLARDGEDDGVPVFRSDLGDCVAAPEGDLVLVNSTGNEVDRQGYGRDRSWLVVDRPGHEPPTDVFGFCGAAVLLRTAVLRSLGDFDDRFFLYYEDTDLSWRMRLTGWSVHYVPAAVAVHRHAASSDVESTLFRFHDDRNRLLTLTKNAPGGFAVRAVLRYPLTALSLARVSPRQRGLTPTRARVVLSYLRLLPAMLRARREIGRTAVRARADVVELG